MWAKKWSRPICGRVASCAWMRSQFHTRTPTTSAACAASSRIFVRASCGSAWNRQYPNFRSWTSTAQAYGVALRPHHAGESFDFGGVHIRVLNPQPDWQATDHTQDDESLVLHLQYGETSALLVGDSHHRIEKLLVEENPHADLLKVGHHGSLTSSSPEFLAAVHPQLCRGLGRLLQPFPASPARGDGAVCRIAHHDIPHRSGGRYFFLPGWKEGFS